MFTMLMSRETSLDVWDMNSELIDAGHYWWRHLVSVVPVCSTQDHNKPWHISKQYAKVVNFKSNLTAYFTKVVGQTRVDQKLSGCYYDNMFWIATCMNVSAWINKHLCIMSILWAWCFGMNASIFWACCFRYFEQDVSAFWV